MKKAMLALTAVLAVISLTRCGGSSNNTPSVMVSPATANVQEGSTQQFSASVTNSADTVVNWTVNGVAGGNSTVGTVSSTGLYTAPDVVPSPASVTVTATLQANSAVSGNGIVTITSVVFNNSSLKGNYVFSLTGIDASGYAFYAVGTVTADGNGNITGGEEDLNDASSGYFQASSVTGTYSVGSDGRGTLNLNSSIGSFSYAIALRALNNAGLNEIDNQVVNATGNLEQQTSGVGAPSGSYAFGFSGTNGACGPLTSAGLFTLGSGNVGGLQDLNCGGTITQAQSLSGTFTGIDSLGRGTGTFSSSALSSGFVYYVVSANRFRFLCPTAGTLFTGSADLQTQSSFANTSFTGSYVVNSSGNSTLGVAYSLIQFNASNGSVSTGYYDVNNTGIVASASLNGAYSLNANGRITGTFNVNGASLPFTIYLVSPTAGYYLDLRSNVVGGGSLYGQSSGVTTNAAWAGSYAIKQFGYYIVGGIISPGNSNSISGQISADGNGTLAGTLDINGPTTVVQGQTLQGTYNVGNVAPGRTTLTITTQAIGTQSYVGYIVSPTRVLLLEVDSNLTASGDAIRQF
jgi:hypothetical protein